MRTKWNELDRWVRRFSHGVPANKVVAIPKTIGTDTMKKMRASQMFSLLRVGAWKRNASVKRKKEILVKATKADAKKKTFCWSDRAITADITPKAESISDVGRNLLITTVLIGFCA